MLKVLHGATVLGKRADCEDVPRFVGQALRLPPSILHGRRRACPTIQKHGVHPRLPLLPRLGIFRTDG